MRASGQASNVGTSSGSLAIIFAAVQPSTPAPSHRICGNRDTHFSTSVEPQITIGIEIARPITTSSMLPCAAPPIASTLSTPMTASATMIVWTAPRNDALASIECSSGPLPSAVSFQPIQTSAAPPTSRKPGILSSQITTDVSATRTAIAPNVPHSTTRRWCSFGTLRAASPMTIALSPASTRSITMMAASADHHGLEKSSGLIGAHLRRGTPGF